MTKKKIKNVKFCKREGIDLELFLNKNKCKSINLLENFFDKGIYSDFGLLLRTKQKIKRYYCIFEKQFKLLYKKVSKKFFDCTFFLILLERRLDNLLFRMNFTNSRKESRQYIIHGFVYVNFNRIKSPSFIISIGDSIFLKNKFLIKKYYFGNVFFCYDWIYLDYFNGFGLLLSFPKKNKFSIDKNLLIDFYK